MSSLTNTVARTAGSSIFNGLLADNASPFVPREPLRSALFGVEHLEIQQLTGTAQPGGTVTYELPYEVDGVKAINQVFRLVAGSAGTAIGSTWGYSDYVGLALIDEITMRFGTERIQTIRPLELFFKMHSYLDNDLRNCLRNLVGGGLTLTQRFQRITSGEQQIVVPLLTLMGLHARGDLSQTLMVRAMTERWRMTVKFSPVNTVIDNTTAGTISIPPAATAAAVPLASTALFSECYLYVEGIHIADDERKLQEKIYMQPRRMLIREHQYCTPVRIPGTLSLSGTTVDISMREINQPVVGIYVFLRWAADLDRTTSPGGSGGCNRFNTRGWFNPGGSITATGAPIISHLEGRVGSNGFWLKKTRVEHLLDYERVRLLKGSGVSASATGQIPAPAIPAVFFSHDPTRENAAFGFIDFAQTDNPVLRIYFQNVGSINSVLGNATINNAANVDIGTNSDLEVLIVADTLTQLNFQKGAALRVAN